MRKFAEIGTKVKTVHDDEGVIVENRKTMPDLRSNFDYCVRIEGFGEDGGPVVWGFGKDELTEVK